MIELTNMVDKSKTISIERINKSRRLRRLASSKVRQIRLTWMEETFQVANHQLHMEEQAQRYPARYLTPCFHTSKRRPK